MAYRRRRAVARCRAGGGRLTCEEIKNLGKRSQKNKLKDIASGQKSMTYVLENFVKRVGAEVEAAHGLPVGACWLIMKGSPRNGRPGLASVLASNRREWMSLSQAVHQVQAFAAVTWDEAGAIIASMKAAGCAGRILGHWLDLRLHRGRDQCSCSCSSR